MKNRPRKAILQQIWIDRFQKPADWRFLIINRTSGIMNIRMALLTKDEKVRTKNNKGGWLFEKNDNQESPKTG